MRTRIACLIAAVAAALAAAPAQAAQHVYSFTLNGPSENPFNPSAGTGTGSAVYDDVALTLTLQATFSGLTGNVTQTHFHGVTSVSGLPDNNPIGETADQAASAVPNTGIAIGNTTLPGFPLGATSGVYPPTVLDLTQASIYNNTFLTNNGGVAGARAAFVGALASGRTYWNVHTSTSPGGEIRGFPVRVPEPATLGLAGVGAAFLAAARRRK